MTQVGERVGAINDGDSEVVRMFGWGVYEGDYLRPDSSPGVFGTGAEMKETAIEVYGPEAGWTEAQRTAVDLMLRNPRIRLDNGNIVWGCQCWWGPESAVKVKIGSRRVEFVPVPEGN